MSGITKETCSEGGENIGGTDNSDYVTYLIDVKDAGRYKVEYRVASEWSSGELSLAVNGSNLGSVTVEGTTGWQDWTTVSNYIELSQGKQTLTLDVIVGGFNLNYINFSYDEIIEENMLIHAENFINQQGLQFLPCNEGGSYLGYVDQGDWVTYSVNIPETNTYKVTYRVASLNGGGSFNVLLDSASIGSLTVDITHGWEKWVNVEQIISLPQGSAELKLDFTNPGLNIQQISIIKDGTQIEKEVGVWKTTIDQSSLLKKQEPTGFGNSGSGEYSFNVNANNQFQEMDGFGASMTESSAFLIKEKLNEGDRNTLMNSLFSYDSGIGISFLRQPMGSSDFALTERTYNDMGSGEDWNLNNFSIERDRDYIIPMLKLAQSINPNIKFMGTPWSAPAWMRWNNSLRGSGDSIRWECYNVWADYFKKFIDSYGNEGLPMYAITVQNEPLYGPESYPSMLLPAEFERDFIKENLGPLFRDSGINTKIIAYDHNFDNTEYSETIYDDPDASQFVAGSGWHTYGGSPEVMNQMHNKYPNMGNWITESGQGNWISNNGFPTGSWEGSFQEAMDYAIKGTRSWSKSILLWNIALDENQGPRIPGFNNNDNYGMVTISQSEGRVTSYQGNYYALGHLSKFVIPGAKRVEVNTYSGELEAVAFINPNGSKVLVLLNRSSTSKNFKVTEDSKDFYYDIEAYAALTLKWD